MKPPQDIFRVAILGAESTGKSTLAAALATHYRTSWVPEYLREFVGKQGRTPNEEDQLGIARMQLAREEQAISQAHTWLFCDTTPIMTAIYSAHYFGSVDHELSALAARHEYVSTIVSAPTTPWIADGLQRESDAVRQHIHRQLLKTLQTAGIPYLLVDGNVETRIAQTISHLDTLKP